MRRPECLIAFAAIATIAGCQQILGLDPPALRDDADASDGPTADTPPADAMPDARVCPTPPTGCTLFTCAGSSSCYYGCGNTAKRQWTVAQDECAAQALGCLATINSQAENDCITNATSPVFPDYLWFGYVQSPGGAEPAGGWGWQCGTSNFVAGNWTAFEPNNSGGDEDCGAISSGGGWIDDDCGKAARFVCELP